MSAPYSPFVLDPAMPREAFEQLVPGSQLTAAAGAGQKNDPADVRRVQARLRELGMTWVPDTGAIGKDPEDPTGRSIRLFLAMLDGKSLWMKQKDQPISEAYKHPTRAVAAIIPASRDEAWLWGPDAPRWLASPPPSRDGWAPAADIHDAAMSSWLAEYLDRLGRAFREKLELVSPVLGAVMAQGAAGLERFKTLDARDAMQKTAALVARVRTDLVEFAAETHQDPRALAKATSDSLSLVIPTLNAASQATGGLSPKHAGHQQGLECDFRLFGHAGPTPTSWNVDNTRTRNPKTSLLLDGLLIDCMLEQPATRKILHNDPALLKRSRLIETADKHDDHIHLYVKGAEARTSAMPPGLGPPGLAPRPVAPVMELAYEATADCPTCGRARRAELELECEAYETDAYAGETYEAEAYEAELQMTCPPTTTIRAISDYIALVQKVERAYSQWKPEQVLAALRRIAGCDSHLFRTLFGTTEGAPVSVGVGGLLATDLCDLASMSAHSGTGGVVYDPWGQEVAVGHVLCGITAGLHRNPKFGLVAGMPLLLSGLQVLAGLTLDNLFATTIAGDLGQSAVMVHLKRQTTSVGPGTEATDAELVGDIDGCVLATSAMLKDRKISDLLLAYYGPTAPAGSTAHFSHRFRLFAPTLNAPALDEQTRTFAKAYLVEVTASQLAESTAPDVTNALAEFRIWFPQKLAAEVGHR